MQGTTINGSRNTPLRGSKRTTLEGGIRVPFVVRVERAAPGRQGVRPAGDPTRHPPDRAGGRRREAQTEWKLDGVNLLPYLDGKNSAAPHDALYWRFGEQMAIRRGDWKLVRYDPAVDGEGQGKRRSDAEQTLQPRRGHRRANDLSEKQPDKRKELETLWQTWNAQYWRSRSGWGKEGKSAG